MSTVAIHTAPDGLLAAVAPLGCAVAGGTVLVVDLDPGGLPIPGGRTLADLVESGPSDADLRPRRSGVACLPNGGIDPDEATEVVNALRASWPRVVLRLADEDAPSDALGVALRPLLPGVPPPERLPTIVQPLGVASGAPDLAGHRLPLLPGRVARALLAGHPAKGAWIRAWRLVWEAT